VDQTLEEENVISVIVVVVMVIVVLVLTIVLTDVKEIMVHVPVLMKAP